MLGRLLPARWRQRGDTLIEVTFALAILSFVLIGSSAIATQGFRVGQTGRERTQISDQAESQLEAIRLLRDNNTWAAFLNGKTGSTGFTGVLDALSSTSCHVTSPCMHMALPAGTPGSELVPAGGGMAGSVPTSYIEVAITPDTNTPPQRISLVVSYGFQPLGGGVMNVGHITTLLTNVQSVASASVPGNGNASLQPGCGADGQPVCEENPQGGGYFYEMNVTNTSNNPPGLIAGCTVDWGDGVTDNYGASDPTCQYLGSNAVAHVYPHVVPELPYPLSCHIKPYHITLTMHLKNGLNPATLPEDNTFTWPNCY